MFTCFYIRSDTTLLRYIVEQHHTADLDFRMLTFQDMESKLCLHLIAIQGARRVTVLILSMVLLLLSGQILVKGQGPVYLFGSNVTLQCVSTTSSVGEQFTWIDQTEAVAIFAVNGPDDKEKTFDGRNNDKYDNFDIDNNFPDNVNLLIKSLEVNDAGIYVCNFFNQAGPEPLTVSIEAIPLSVSISCARKTSTDCSSPSSSTSASFSCNCTAIGAYPRSLQFEWSSGATVGQQSRMNNTEKTGTFDFHTNAEISPTENPGSVTCTLDGYEGNWREEDRNAAYNFNPPMCELKSICNDTNTGVSLTCTCTDASPAEGLVYSIFRDGELLSIGDTNVFEAAIEMGQEYTFGCRGCNGVNYGSESYVTQTVACQETTIVTTEQQPITDNQSLASTNTKEQSPTNDDMSVECNYTGLIVVCIVEAIIIVVLIVVIIYLIARDRLGHGKNTEPRSTNQIDEIKGAGNRAYMDLRELEVNKNNKNKNLEVPEKNVKLVSLLPGKGMMQYHKALVMRAAGNLEAVVRTLSGDSTLRMNELQSSEVQHILKLPGDNNIMKLLGWCDTVPNYLICENLSGGTLSDHLTEEFSSQKVHQYGNTKRKRFQVAEKGNAEHLPKYALQVARGLKFLTKHRFVSPGLRSKKVLLDASGRCKLYDFVSMENAKEWTKLFWNENVPFQWMPPEFLFLETISPAGDVWSFGVLLWEILSYGSEPYKGQTRSDVEKSLRAKRQLPMPDNCPGAIWQVMITCWEPAVEERLKIDDVTYKLAAMCHEDKEYQEIG